MGQGDVSTPVYICGDDALEKLGVSYVASHLLHRYNLPD